MTNPTKRSLLYWTSHIPSKTTPTRRNRRNPRRIQKAQKGIQRRTIPTPAKTHDMGPCHRIVSRRAPNATRKTTPTNPTRNRRGPQVRRRPSKTRNHQRVLESLCSQLLLRQEERWQTATRTRLSTPQQMDEKEQKRLSPHSPNHRQTERVYAIHQIRRTMGIQQHPHQKRRRMESCIPNPRRIVRAYSNVLRPHQLPCDIPNDDEYNIPQRSSPRMALSLHGRHCHPHKATTRRITPTTPHPTLKINSPRPQQTRKRRPLPQIRKMCLCARRN